MFSFKQFKRYLIYILKSKKNIDKSFQEFDKKILDIQDKMYYNKKQLLECREHVDVFKITKQIDEEKGIT